LIFAINRRFVKFLYVFRCFITNRVISGDRLLGIPLRSVRVGLKSEGTDDGTLSRPRICKPLYGPSQGDETGD